jgi:hypothetical protein
MGVMNDNKKGNRRRFLALLLEVSLRDGLKYKGTSNKV